MWINPAYPIYNWGYNPLTKWDEPPSKYFSRLEYTVYSVYAVYCFFFANMIDMCEAVQPKMWQDQPLTLIQRAVEKTIYGILLDPDDVFTWSNEPEPKYHSPEYTR